MKMVAIKRGNKTTYKMVPDDWKEENSEKPDYQTGDLTTGSIKSLYIGMTKEQHDRIFGKEEK